MKRLLSMLGAIVIAGGSVSGSVACTLANDNHSNGGKTSINGVSINSDEQVDRMKIWNESVDIKEGIARKVIGDFINNNVEKLGRDATRDDFTLLLSKSGEPSEITDDAIMKMNNGDSLSAIVEANERSENYSGSSVQFRILINDSEFSMSLADGGSNWNDKTKYQYDVSAGDAEEKLHAGLIGMYWNDNKMMFDDLGIVDQTGFVNVSIVDLKTNLIINFRNILENVTYGVWFKANPDSFDPMFHDKKITGIKKGQIKFIQSDSSKQDLGKLDNSFTGDQSATFEISHEDIKDGFVYGNSTVSPHNLRDRTIAAFLQYYEKEGELSSQIVAADINDDSIKFVYTYKGKSGDLTDSFCEQYVKDPDKVKNPLDVSFKLSAALTSDNLQGAIKTDLHLQLWFSASNVFDLDQYNSDTKGKDFQSDFWDVSKTKNISIRRQEYRDTDAKNMYKLTNTLLSYCFGIITNSSALSSEYGVPTGVPDNDFAKYLKLDLYNYSWYRYKHLPGDDFFRLADGVYTICFGIGLNEHANLYFSGGGVNAHQFSITVTLGT